MRRCSSPQHDSATSQPYDKSTLLDSPVYNCNRTALQIPVKRNGVYFLQFCEDKRKLVSMDYKSLRNEWIQIKEAMDGRSGHKAIKDAHDATSWMVLSLFVNMWNPRVLGADRVRKTGITHKKEASRPFSDNCSEKEGFRIAVKRTRPGMLDDAVKSAMQEECINIHFRAFVGKVKCNLLGQDFMEEFRGIWDYDTTLLVLSYVLGKRRNKMNKSSRVVSVEDCDIPAGHEAIVKGRLASRDVYGEGVLLPLKKFIHEHVRNATESPEKLNSSVPRNATDSLEKPDSCVPGNATDSPEKVDSSVPGSATDSSEKPDSSVPGNATDSPEKVDSRVPGSATDSSEKPDSSVPGNATDSPEKLDSSVPWNATDSPEKVDSRVPGNATDFPEKLYSSVPVNATDFPEKLDSSVPGNGTDSPEKLDNCVPGNAKNFPEKVDSSVHWNTTDSPEKPYSCVPGNAMDSPEKLDSRVPGNATDPPEKLDSRVPGNATDSPEKPDSSVPGNATDSSEKPDSCVPENAKDSPEKLDSRVPGNATDFSEKLDSFIHYDFVGDEDEFSFSDSNDSDYLPSEDTDQGSSDTDENAVRSLLHVKDSSNPPDYVSDSNDSEKSIVVPISIPLETITVQKTNTEKGKQKWD
ncbi:dentin sialophosphoprotein-like [Magallana gigas]|uniref:dentin sialophosphoprotein-like n=1 Tax=Magallana gigas TaxID=29159 RepID=UPI00333F21CB